MTPVRFGLLFVAAFAILMGSFEASRGTAFERSFVEDLILGPTTSLINPVTPRDPVELVGRAIVSPRANLRVTRGCEGVEMFLMLVAGILSFPATLIQRASGLLWGSMLAYILSVGRLMALHYVLRSSPNAWEVLHGLVLPLGPILLMALYFLRWSRISAVREVPSEPTPHAA